MADWISPFGCVKEIGKYILTQCLCPPVKCHFDYWWCFDNNIRGLKDEIRDLYRETYDIDQKIEEVRRNAEQLRPEVQDWSNMGTEKLEEARRILQDDNIPKAWNLISRYSVGKSAKKTAEEIAKHRKDGTFTKIADPVLLASVASTSDSSTMAFESRKCIEEDILESLGSSSVSMIGICGMGGVGKTTMVDRIEKRAREKLFDEFVTVVVGQQKDMSTIQEEIAELLGMKFDEKFMSARAKKLHTRLMDEKRKIIIFDDVWKSLKLKDLGVPFESGFERCKILLTTRSKDICVEMEAQKVITLEVLTEEEAWSLFKQKAGDCVEESVLRQVAKDVVAECKRLPIALVTVGKALHNERVKRIWVDSLKQLKESNPTNLSKVLEDVYKPLKLSYDHLKNQSEELLFLLCCLFPEDYDIPVEHLTWYSMGLSILDGIRNIEEARNSMHGFVKNLKSRFLLMDGRDENHVKMHDIVRDVAIFIGSKERKGFLKSLEVNSMDFLREDSTTIDCNWMSVSISNGRIILPLGLHFPNLRLLMMMKLTSDISFEGMEDLNVLYFSMLESSPPTLGLLKNLQTLHLYRSTVTNISVVGELASLEILSCFGCYNIEELPAEIGRLNRLRLLELCDCKRLQAITFGVISSLVQLEELKMVDSFRNWEAEEKGIERRNAALTELQSLPNLTCLEIEISYWNLAAQEICLSQKLVKKLVNYCINISDNYEDGEKAIILELPSHIYVGKCSDEKCIIESLRNSSVSMIGICGMGGVGKTTMVQRIKKRVREENLFDEVVMVVVSAQVDMFKIQNEIAESLGLKFDVESMSARANKLRTRLMDTMRKIIIFDDVWERLKLEDLGVPFESGFEGCKILFTARSKDLCLAMKAQKVITLEFLTEEEAWYLFKEKAGDCVEDPILLSVAKDVAAECKGLPITLVTVGMALQNERDKCIWENSLSQLRGSYHIDFPEVLAHVYNPLKLSYDCLKNKSEKLLFLLCCLFPEDYDIPVEHLTWYSMGLSMLDGIRNIEEARNSMHGLVKNLKSRFLLLNGRDENHVKMHDVVRDVAIFIGSKEMHGFLKSLEVTSMDSLTEYSSLNCNWMSVSISNERINLPLGLHFPNLRLLMMLKSTSDISFEGMKDLNVLYFSMLESSPPTLRLLKNLRTLQLYRSPVTDISVVGELASLEILSCFGCYNIEELPAEIGRLNRLRLLDLCYCKRLQTIAFGIISSLVQLEELKMLYSFSNWEAEEMGKERRNAALTELQSLPNLACLQIQISDWNLAAQEIRLSQKLVKYCISISDNYEDGEKAMTLNLPSHITVGKWIHMLVRNTETLVLKGYGSNNFNLAKSRDLRNLTIESCSTVKKLVNTNDCKFGTVFPLLESLFLHNLEKLEKICDATIPEGSSNLRKSPNQNVSLGNLTTISIWKCFNLRCLFPVSIASSLLQLEVLDIQFCDTMEQVFWNEIKSITAVSIVFPKLKKLTLKDLQNLTTFCQGVETIQFPQLKVMEFWNLPKLNSLASLN